MADSQNPLIPDIQSFLQDLYGDALVRAGGSEAPDLIVFAEAET